MFVNCDSKIGDECLRNTSSYKTGESQSTRQFSCPSCYASQEIMGARRLISFKDEFMQRGEQANPHSPNSSLVQVVKHQQRLFAVVRAGEAIKFFQVHATR
jgi:hypothetical protein